MHSALTTWCNKDIRGLFYLGSELQDALGEKELQQVIAYFNRSYDAWVKICRPKKALQPLFVFVPCKASENTMRLKMYVEVSGEEALLLSELFVGVVGEGLALPSYA